MPRVLIVDDNPTVLKLLRMQLGSPEFALEEAGDGAEALRRARKDPPDLVISDLLMPVMDGFTLLRHWKADERLRRIPFIVHTSTFTDPKDEQLAHDLGADAFIVKPAPREPFIARIRDLLAAPGAPGPGVVRAPSVECAQWALERHGEVLLDRLIHKVRELEQTERDLRTTEQRLRLFIEHAPAALAMFDRGMRYVAASQRWLRDHGLEGQPIVGRCHHEFPANGVDRWREAHRRALHGEALRAEEDRIVGADESVRWLRWESLPWHDPEGGIAGTVIFSEDISAAKLAATELAEHATRVQALARRIAEAEELERRRIGRELHDSVGQALTALSIKLHLLGRELERTQAESARTLLADAQTVVGEVLGRVENVMLELRPPLLATHGLAPALRAFAEDFMRVSGVAVAVSAPPEGITGMTEQAATALFRIVQEALNNVIKHAEATHVAITLARERGSISLRVADNGRGFDPSAVAADTRPHWGMTTMHERAESLGGLLGIDSAPGRGTALHVRVPV